MELTTPITIYWDLPTGEVDPDILLSTCQEIESCRPLMLQLRVAGDTVDTATLLLLEQLKKTPIAVSLTVSLATSFNDLLNYGLKELLLAVDSVEALALVLTSAEFTGFAANVATAITGFGISFPVTFKNWRELPALAVLCRKHEIRRLVLPMQRLYNGEIPFLLSASEQSELAASLEAVKATDGLNLTIHDPFLWRTFNPGIAFPQCGCQAANTMIAIAPDNGVYPCPTLPMRIGEIGVKTLKEIVSSAEKKRIRGELLAKPEACNGCYELEECRGGCRGRALVINGSLDGIDLACK